MKNKLLIGISGHLGSGKTTFSNLLKDELEKSYKVKFLNFADKLKEICFILTGYKGTTQEEKQIFLPDWNRTVGQILQHIGTEAMRDHFDNDVWVKSTISEVERDSETDIFIIGDCRFPNEATAIQNKGGIIIRITGDPANTRKNSNRDLNHPSEISLDNYESFDFVLNNDSSMKDLVQKAEFIAKYVLIKLQVLNN